MRRAAFVLATCVVLGGCGLLDKADEANDQILQKINDIHADTVAAREKAEREKAEAVAAGDSQAAKIAQANIERLATAEAMLEQARREAEAAKTGGIAEWVVGVVAPFVPAGPWRELIVWGGGLLTAAEVARRKQRGLKTLAASVVKLAGEDPNAAAAVKAHADMLRSIQSPEAKRAIDKAQESRGAA